MQVIGLDHVVLLCRDIEKSLAFYTGVLGLEGVLVEEWRKGEVFFPAVRVDETTIIDLFPGEPDGRNTDHVCLIIEPTDLNELAKQPKLNFLQGPIERGGALGNGWSIYISDPDGYTLELKHHGATPEG
jgi:catechol 2,3-dioxygenase-like lactoylglutathione lyase family enzyme